MAFTVVIGIVLRMGITSALFRFYFDSPEPARRRLVLRTSFWFTMSMATLGLVAGLALSPQISDLLFGTTGRLGARCGERREPLGQHELRAADVALPARGALHVVRRSEPREHLPHRRRDARSRRRVRCGAARRHRRELRRHLDRVPRARRLPERAARAPVRPRPPSGDEPLRHPAHAYCALPLGHELQRPAVPREALGHVRGRPLLHRSTHRLGDGAPAHGVPACLACLCVLDRGRTRGAAHVRVRADVSRARHDLGRNRAHAPVPLDRRVAHHTAVRERVASRRPAHVRRRRVRRLHRGRDRRRDARAARSSTGSSPVPPPP